MKPNMRPARPDFSSGPSAKRPGWTPEVLLDAAVGRSPRSKLGKKKIVEAVDRTRAILGIPADYRIAIVPASDTGAVEMALWSLLGARPVDMLTWESFGEGWVTDVVKQLKLKDARVLKALIARADANTKALADWKAKTPWIDFLAADPAIRSNTSVCMKVIDPAITELSPDAQADFAKKLVAAVEKENAGFDFAHYRDAPAGLRIWCGATVEAKDVEILTQWIDWAFAETKASLAKAA